VVLVSGEGRELSKAFSYVDNHALPGEIVAVIADDPGTKGITAASERGIRTFIVAPTGFIDSAAFNREINDILDKLSPDAVILDGFARPVRLRERANRLVTDRADVLLEMAPPD
jgi:phosphoribosylglycinamide formyltransferase-1